MLLDCDESSLYKGFMFTIASLLSFALGLCCSNYINIMSYEHDRIQYRDSIGCVIIGSMSGCLLCRQACIYFRKGYNIYLCKD